jgi:hypothetical protein
MDDADDAPPMESVDPEMRQLLGLFDVPAFARRGQDLEFALGRLQARCRREREAMLEMVRLRLRQWAAAVEGPDAWRGIFDGPLDGLWGLASADPPAWGASPAAPRRRRAIARDLVASVQRFNRRWGRFLDELDLRPINDAIDQYNRYYVLEKECILSSARLAARHFVPRPRLTPEGLRADYPPLRPPTLQAP